MNSTIARPQDGISTMPSPSLSPLNITARLGDDFKTDPVITKLAGAMDEMHGAWQAMIDARKTNLSDPSQTHQGALLRVAQFAEERQRRATKRVDEIYQHARDELRRIDAMIDSTLRSKLGLASTGTEIRAYIRSLPANERLGFVMARIDESDAQTVAAVVFGKPWLSGLSPVQRTLIREKWTTAHHADAYARRKAIENSLEILTDAGRIFLDGTLPFIKSPELDAVRKRRQDADRSLKDQRAED